MPLGKKPHVLRFDAINLLLMQTQQKGNQNEAAWGTEGSPLSAGVKTTPVTPVKWLPVKCAILTRTCSGGNNGVIKQLIKILCRDKAAITATLRKRGRKK